MKHGAYSFLNEHRYQAVRILQVELSEHSQSLDVLSEKHVAS